jgi:predicted nuclease of predicted toxin-antitoxin system
MKFKLDENLGSLGKALLAADGHDVMTVAEQKLDGVSDDVLYRVCCDERRVLITLDRDFGEVLRYPPEASAGIVVLASPGRLSPQVISARIAEFTVALRANPLNGELWIVEPGRVRIHQRRNSAIDGNSES